MANGPMGGFMPTPAAPAQPPSVKLETTAISRGNFNTFLKNMNGAMNPPLAPMVGAEAPLLAPTISNIDIFNPPMQMMQFGGEVDDFGDFSSVGDDAPSVDDGSSFSDDAQATDFGGGSDDNEQSIVGDDPIADLDFNVVTTPTVTEQERQQNIQDAENFITGTTQFPNTQNFGSRVNLTGDVLEDIKKNINLDNEKILSEDDKFFNKDGSITTAGQTELDKMNALTLADVRSGVIPSSNFITATSASDVLGDKNIADALSLKEIDAFEIQPTFKNTGLPGAGNLPTVGSTRSTVAQDQAKAIANLVGDKTPTIAEQLQQNVLAERGRALGPTTFSDDLANFQERVTLSPPPEGFEEQVGTMGARIGGGMFPKMYAPGQSEIRYTTKGTTPQEQRELRELRDIDEAIEVAERGPLTFQTQTQKSTAPEDFEENVGRRFDADRMADIERLYGEDIGQTKAGRGSDPTFFEGRGMTGTLGAILDAIERKTRENMATEVALGRPMGLGETLFGFTAPNLQTQTMKDYMANTQKNVLNEAGDAEIVSRRLPDNQLVRNESGRIIAIKDKNGNVVSGVDPNAQIPSGDDGGDSPIIRPIVPKKEEEKTPTNIGMMGGANPFLPSQSSVVVDSPFTTNVGDFQGTRFTTGDLNRLIAQLTGVQSPRSMAKGGVAKFANGGLIKAVDDFLATGT